MYSLGQKFGPFLENDYLCKDFITCRRA